MSSLNRIMIIGNVGNDPEIVKTQNSKVAKVSIATTEKYKDEEKTEWHNVEMWGKLADIVEQYVSKGSKIYVEGSLKTDSWEKDGEKKYKTKITAYRMLMLDYKGNNSGQSKPQSNAPNNFDDSEEPLPF